uniref:Uncharacterized protein n=1 Tax=Anguilla anguilla TaxID=7936 RepID=A0A0E9V9W0_ANGAN
MTPQTVPEHYLHSLHNLISLDCPS